MKLAEFIITEARERGLRHFFGLPGGGSPLDMMEVGSQLDVSFVSVAHESSAAIMAAYYGLMKNTAGLALSVKGIGAGNLWSLFLLRPRSTYPLRGCKRCQWKRAAI